MTREETMKVLSVLRVAYPQFYRGITKADAMATVNLWTDMFRDEPYELVEAAVKALIAGDEKGFPPHVGAVKARIRQITEPQELTEGEAWALVMKAVKNLDWLEPERQWDKLPEAVRRAVGDVSVLVEWAKTDSGTFSTVIASNFQRTYRARQQADKAYAAIPGDVRTMMSRLSSGLALEEAGT